MLTRREFLQASAVAGAGLLVPWAWAPRSVFAAPLEPATLTKYTEPLPIPPGINATAGGRFELSLAPGTHKFHSSLPPTPTWGYSGAAYLGPTFETRRGVPIDVTAINNLGPHPLAYAIDPTLMGAGDQDKSRPRAAVHLHGGNTEPRSDGGPLDTFRPHARYQYHYHNDQEATTLWYHDHALGITRLNVMAGLAGFYLLRDDWDTGRPGGPLNLPTGKYEVPLVLQDRMFNADGTLAYPPGAGAIWAPEFFGDVATVNGKAWPNLAVDRGWYRLRMLNGSNARFYNLRLSTGQPLYQIGTDGGLLNAPVPMGQLLLGPGERADVLIDFSGVTAGTTIQLTNNAVTPFPNGPRSTRKGGVPLREIMQFTVGANGGYSFPSPGALPTTLRPTTRPIPSPLLAPVRVRNLTVVEIMGPNQPLAGLLNNLPFDTQNIERPKVDTVEQWNIINTTGDAHPIHLHLVQFLVKERQTFDAAAYLARHYPNLGPATMRMGPWPAPSADPFVRGAPRGPDPNEVGWKDTVRVMPGEITRLLVPFGAKAAGVGVPLAIGQSFTGTYVWHCHILEHEDNEMMLQYQVMA